MEKHSPNLKSSIKSNKYKSFLATFLSPSVSKRPAKKNSKLHSSLSINNDNFCSSSIETYHSNDSIYSSLNEAKTQPLPLFQSEKLDSTRPSEQFSNASKQLIISKDETLVKEPLYASVNKNKNISSELQQEKLEIVKYKEDNKILKEQIKNLSEENRSLREKLSNFIKEEKRKKEILHSRFQLKITELEAETRKDVKTLSERLQILNREKEILNDQIDILQQEKREFQEIYDDVCTKLKTMVSSDVHKTVLIEHQRLMKDVKDKHIEELDRLKEQYSILKESKTSAEYHIEELKNKVTSLEANIETLEKINAELLEEKNNLLEQNEELKHMEQDIQTLLLSLLKVTENIAMERNVLLNRTSFQDHQQQEIQTTVIDYSLNIGRLQEHILNLNKDNLQELHKLKTNKYYEKETLQQTYGKQLDILREKILVQHNKIADLENEKRKLESQLELIWQAACGTSSKLFEDVKEILNKQINKNL